MFPSPREHSLTLHFQDVLSRCEKVSHFSNFSRVGISSWNTVYNSYSARLVKAGQDAPEVSFLFLNFCYRRCHGGGLEFGGGLMKVSDGLRSAVSQFLNAQILCAYSYL